MFTTIIIMVGIFGLLYFLMIRPQRKKMQAQQNLLRNIQVGDDVLTAAGIYGRISSFDEDSLFIEVSDNNHLKITRDSIVQKISYGAAEETNGSKDSGAIGSGKSSEQEITEESETEEASENE